MSNVIYLPARVQSEPAHVTLSRIGCELAMGCLFIGMTCALGFLWYANAVAQGFAAKPSPVVRQVVEVVR